jgi:hypothetical protein
MADLAETLLRIEFTRLDDPSPEFRDEISRKECRSLRDLGCRDLLPA